MFERYTDQCKRAIFYAQQTALDGSATAIDSVHLLLGLLSEKETRADNIFRLRELFPEETSQQANLIKQQMTKGTIPLSGDGKRAVAYAGREANQLRDYWVDTEHMVLGILREEANSAAAKLRAVGLGLESCRQLVISNKNSQPPRQNPVLFWVSHYPISFALLVVLVFLLGITTALILFGFVGMGSAFAILAMLLFLAAVRREGSAT
jgi:ATP-dependent Clp protease ATP-binding subunit ClpA